MALVKKGSRRIVLGGVSYRWTVRPKPTYGQGLNESSLSFAVSLEHAGLTTLVVTLDAARPDNWVGARAATVTPILVAEAISQALARGWLPHQKGSPFRLVLSVARAKVTEDAVLKTE